jgi:PAS domain S-box-containing protein
VRGPGQPVTCELMLRRADQTTLPVHLESAPFVDPAAKTCRSHALLIDLTTRRQAEEALRASERRYRLLHESMTDAFVSVDMAGRILNSNPAYQQMLGYSPAELGSLTYMDLTPPRWHAFEARLVREQVLPHGYSRVYEKQYQRHDGTLLPVELRTFLLRDEQGQPAEMWAIVRDITERKQAQAALAASQAALLAANTQLRQANEELEQRVAARTAQLRKLAAELLHAEERERRRAADVLHEGLQQLLVNALYSLQGLKRWSRNRTFTQELQELTGCINDSINVTRTLSYDLSPPGLHELGLAAALQWLADWHESKHGLVVEVQADNHPEPEAEAVQIVLFRAARELLLNAAKHAHVKRVRVHLGRTREGEVRMVVHDAGTGFDPARLHAKGHGREGSGLRRVRERLEMLGGSLAIQSAPGAGCRITITIPPPPRPSPPAATAGKVRRKPKRRP